MRKAAGECWSGFWESLIRKVMVHAEHVLFVNPETRGVRLDVYADDEHGTVYNVENADNGQ